jgi:hypothetical protein
MSGSFDHDQWWADYQRQEAERLERSEQLARYAAGALRFLGVRKVEVEFDGSGDDGEVQEPVYTPTPSHALPEGLEALVTQACHGLLPGGWEINAGSFGTITINVAKGTCAVDQTWREEEEYDEDEME